MSVSTDDPAITLLQQQVQSLQQQINQLQTRGVTPTNVYPAYDLPISTPGASDSTVGVDEADGALRRFPMASLPLTNVQKAALDAVVAGQTVGYSGYATFADLPAPGTANRVALVGSDPNPDNNGTWRDTGTAWVKADDRVSEIKESVSALASEFDGVQSDVAEVNAAILRTEVPGYLAAIVDSLNRMTDIAVRRSDGQIPDFVMSRWGKRLGITHKDVPGYLLTFTDSEDRMTDLSIRESDGQFADFVIKRLALRLVNYLDFDKDTIVPASYGTSRLRGTRMKLGKIAAGDASSQLNIAFIGDSWTAGSNYWLLALANRMYSEIGFGGYGFVGPTDGAANTVDLTITKTGSWATGALGSAAPDNRSIVSGAVNDEWLLRCNVWTASRPLSRAVTSARLIYKGTGTISYKWQDADDYTDVAVDSATPAYIDLANLPTPATTGSYAWVLHVKMSAASMTFYGAILNSGTNGVVAHKMGASSTTSANWYKSTDSAWNSAWIQAATPISADAYFVMFGMNDQTAQFSVETYLANMQGIVANIRSINAGADIHLCMQPRTTVAGTAIFASYFSALKAWAYSDGKIAVTNLQEVFGPDYQEYAVDGNYPLIDSTNAHPAPLTGGRVITESFFRIISEASE